MTKKKAAPHRRRVTVDTPSFSRPLQCSRLPRRASLSSLSKNVQFSEMSEVCVIEKTSSTANDWYTIKDQRRFKKERLSDVVSFRREQRKMFNARRPSPSSAASASSSTATTNPIQEVDACPVGIEHLLSTKGAIDAQKHKKNVIRSIIQEQNRQKMYNKGYCNPDAIAILSVQLTAQALDGAINRGKFQEMAKFV